MIVRCCHVYLLFLKLTFLFLLNDDCSLLLRLSSISKTNIPFFVKCTNSIQVNVLLGQFIKKAAEAKREKNLITKLKKQMCLM